MLSNEQCDKAPYGPVGAAWQPHSHAYHSPNLFDDGFTVSLVQCIFIPNKTDRHQRTIPGARPYVSCLGQIEGANNIWGSRRNILANKCLLMYVPIGDLLAAIYC